MATPNMANPKNQDPKISNKPTLKDLRPLKIIPLMNNPIKIATKAHKRPKDNNIKFDINLILGKVEVLKKVKQ